MHACMSLSIQLINRCSIYAPTLDINQYNKQRINETKRKQTAKKASMHRHMHVQHVPMHLQMHVCVPPHICPQKQMHIYALTSTSTPACAFTSTPAHTYTNMTSLSNSSKHRRLEAALEKARSVEARYKGPALGLSRFRVQEFRLSVGFTV